MRVVMRESSWRVFADGSRPCAFSTVPPRDAIAKIRKRPGGDAKEAMTSNLLSPCGRGQTEAESRGQVRGATRGKYRSSSPKRCVRIAWGGRGFVRRTPA